MRTPNTKLQCWTRFKTSNSAANVAAARIDGLVGKHFATLIDTSGQLAKGFVHDWPGTWSTSDKMTILQQFASGMKVVRELARAMKYLAEIYEKRQQEFAEHLHEKIQARRTIQQPSGDPDLLEGICTASQPGPSQQQFVSSTVTDKLQPLFVNDMKEVKEEPLDEHYSNYQQPGTSRSYQPVDGELFEEDVKPSRETILIHADSSSQSFNYAEYDDVKPPRDSSSLPAVPKEEEGFGEPQADMFCPTTGDARPIGEFQEEVATRNQRFQYQLDSSKLASQVYYEDCDPRNGVEIPYHREPKSCYLCNQTVHHYLITPDDEGRRAAFLDNMILKLNRYDRTRMSHLKLGDARAFFCEKHIANGREKPMDDEPPHVKKRRTQELLKRIKSIGAEGDAANKKTEPASPSIAALEASNAAQNTARARLQYSKKCDLCNSVTYSYRYPPNDPIASRNFFGDLVNLTDEQRIRANEIHRLHIRAVICSKHLQPFSGWSAAPVRRYTIRAPQSSANPTPLAAKAANDPSSSRGKPQLQSEATPR